MAGVTKMKRPKRVKVGKKGTSQRLDTYSGRAGAIIRARRESLELTADDLRQMMALRGMDVSLPTIYSWESGRAIMPLEALPIIASALKTSPKKLLPDD